MADTEQKYVVPNKDGSLGTRDSSGKLDVVNEGGGPIKMKPGSDWQPWAGMAGGGLAAYMLAKTLMGDDDDGKKGKKGKSFLRSIVPWLAAIAGGVGGHALVSDLSKMVAKGKPAGSAAAKVNEDGTVSLPDPADMPTGAPLYTAAGITGGTGIGLLARGFANRWATRPQRLNDAANTLAHQAARAYGRGNHTLSSTLQQASGELRTASATESARRLAIRNGSGGLLDTSWLRAREAFGHNLNHGHRFVKGLANYKGNLALGASALASAPLLAWYGHARNSKLEELRDLISSLQQNGYEAVK